MKTQLLSIAGKAVFSPVVFCCLWAFAVPADARAQQFSNPTCTVQSIDMGGIITWQIKGVTQVTGLPAQPS
jgi:hypothetical protein